MAHRNWIATGVGLIAAIAAIAATPANAGEIIYDQPATSPVVSTRTSQFFPAGDLFGFHTFDNFTLTSTQSISDVHWQGSYFNLVAPSLVTVPTNNAFSFTVQFFSSVGGVPGAVLGAYAFSPTDAHETFVGSQLAFGTTLAIYDYVVDLATPFVAQAGVEYWLHIYARQPAPSETEAQWGWNGGSGGDGIALQADGAGPALPIVGDRAFALSIPEPATALLVLAGLAGLAASRRRR